MNCNNKSVRRIFAIRCWRGDEINRNENWNVGVLSMTLIGIKQARCRTLKRRKRIARSLDANDPHQARHRIREYLRSFDAKLTATAKAYRKMHSGAKLPKSELAENAA